MKRVTAVLTGAAATTVVLVAGAMPAVLATMTGGAAGDLIKIIMGP